MAMRGITANVLSRHDRRRPRRPPPATGECRPDWVRVGVGGDTEYAGDNRAVVDDVCLDGADAGDADDDRLSRRVEQRTWLEQRARLRQHTWLKQRARLRQHTRLKQRNDQDEHGRIGARVRRRATNGGDVVGVGIAGVGDILHRVAGITNSEPHVDQNRASSGGRIDAIGWRAPRRTDHTRRASERAPGGVVVVVVALPGQHGVQGRAIYGSDCGRHGCVDAGVDHDRRPDRDGQLLRED
ncbi:hypothetical protein VDGE_21569, partial [Verticillium dahliae]